jgi:hypothetical protein
MRAKLPKIVAILALLVMPLVADGSVSARAATSISAGLNSTAMTGPGRVAHVSCYGDYCSGKDPMSTGCNNGAITTAVLNLSWGTVNLRWSPVCKTNWARIYVYPTRTLAPGFVVAEQSTGYTQTGSIYAIASFSAQSETSWSPMIYSPSYCVRAGVNLGTGYSWNTEWTGCD